MAELLDNVADFQKEAGKLLSKDNVDVEDIDKVSSERSTMYICILHSYWRHLINIDFSLVSVWREEQVLR